MKIYLFKPEREGDPYQWDGGKCGQEEAGVCQHEEQAHHHGDGAGVSTQDEQGMTGKGLNN